MPAPLNLYDNPTDYWHLITTAKDVDFEDQHFDRKEAARPESDGHLASSKLTDLIQHAKETISAFANANLQGGVLVLGVSSKGEVKGLSHLNDSQRNNLANPASWLVNHNARAKFIDCEDEAQKATKVCLIFVPYTANAICHTPDKDQRAWLRQGAQNSQLTAEQIDQLRRDKHITSFERERCCEFNKSDLDAALLAEFRKVYHNLTAYDYSDEDLLYQAGAIMREGGKPYFTNAGFLFFAANPQRLFDWAYVRLLRYEAILAKSSEVGLVSLDQRFTGPLPTQIRKIRAYFQESGFFKKYQIRNSSGSGFTDQPEFPLTAIDEVVVNAVVHREYAVHLPVECKKFEDAFVVENAGRLLQRDREVPKDFSLSDVALEHLPRNPKILDWFKLLKDERGAEFVRALSEGTRRMRDEMVNNGLPAPAYHIKPSATVVTLFNNAAEREARLKSSHGQATEFANLFPLQITNIKAVPLRDYPQLRTEITKSLAQSLERKGWFIDRFSHSRIVAHKRGSELPLNPSASGILRFYPAYSLQVRVFWGAIYLTIDYELQVKNVLSVVQLLREISAESITGLSAIAYWNGWQRGKITEIFEGSCTVKFFDLEACQSVPADKVIPNLPTRIFDGLLEKRGITFDLRRAIKQASLASEPNAARTRAARTLAAVSDIASTIFPIALPTGPTVSLQPTPAALSRDLSAMSGLTVFGTSEPVVEFHYHQETPDIRDGITRFGAYNIEARDIELIPVCTNQSRDRMAALIERLKVGKFKYRGAERTFSTRFSYSSIIAVPKIESIFGECERLLSEHPNWSGSLKQLFLIETPERGYTLDDENSPYYKVKRYLLEAGMPSQMVDTPTLLNPDFKDLNLALNITAKCGVVPWVLPGAIPDADFFIGLSYTENRKKGTSRTMGYANVFNAYGRWQLYSANSETFPYDKKAEYFSQLVGTTLEKLSLSESPSIYFHYSAKFSIEDKKAITQAARKVRPHGTFSFVWVNSTHNVRFYDNRPDGDGSLRRGSFVVSSPRQVYLSTTGFNPFRKALGTPQMLELNIFTEEPDGSGRREYDLRALSYQILSLTKLNWASTDSLCAEPITTKYAGSIAYLTAAFLRQGSNFRVHDALEKTPWFI